MTATKWASARSKDQITVRRTDAHLYSDEGGKELVTQNVRFRPHLLQGPSYQ